MDQALGMFLPPDATLSAEELRRRLERADHLLACYQMALGHELPNHLVAIRGLTQMLQLDEAEHLGEDGRDYVRRLVGAAQRVQTLVGGLADLGRAMRDSWQVEHVALAEAIKEAVAEIKKLCPEAVFEYHLCEPAPVLAVSRKALHRVLVQ